MSPHRPKDKSTDRNVQIDAQRVPPARWQTQPLPAARAEQVRAVAHAALDEQLAASLAHLQSTSHVTAEKLERVVQNCVQSVGGSILGKLLESEAWIAEGQDLSRAACPSCGQMSPRARNEQDQPVFDTMTLQTLVGPVRWQAPLFACPNCRRFFSPSPPTLRAGA